jgi:hypothetical protein
MRHTSNTLRVVSNPFPCLADFLSTPQSFPCIEARIRNYPPLGQIQEQQERLRQGLETKSRKAFAKSLSSNCLKVDQPQP